MPRMFPPARWRRVRHRFGWAAIPLVVLWLAREVVGFLADLDFLSGGSWAWVGSPWFPRILVLGAAVFIAVTYLMERRKEPEVPSPRTALVSRALSLSRELRNYHEEQTKKALMPLDILRDVQHPERRKSWQTLRDAEVLAEYQRLYHGRVDETYEEMRAWRGYEHPMMQGRYRNVRMLGEILTVAIGLEDVAKALPEQPLNEGE